MTNSNERIAGLWLAGGIGALLLANAVARARRAYDFSGRTVVITGGSRGLGLVMARQFAAEGAFLVLAARKDDEPDRAERALREQGATVLTVPCDVTDELSVRRMIAEATDCFGKVDVLVNNAGVIQAGPMESMTREDYEQALAVHFWGPYHTVHAVLPQMRARGEGRIVNISSIGGKIAFPHLLPYTVSKFALVGFSQGLRAELRHNGIVVTTVCPGLMRTGSHLNAQFKGRHEEEYRWFALSDTLPGSSMSAERAVGQIIRACRYGDAETILSLPAHAAALFNGLFPEVMADMLACVNQSVLPPADAGAEGTVAQTGFESRSVSPVITALGERSAARNNELPAAA